MFHRIMDIMPFQYNSGFITHIMICVMLMAPCFVFPVFGKKEDPEYEETTVLFQVPGVGAIEIPALVNGEKIYLSVTAIFDFLKIKNTLSAGSDALSGFLITEEAEYLIDKAHNSIRFQGKVFPLQDDDLIQRTTNLYMNPEIFGRVFGLACKFSFRTLTVNMSTQLELPVIREMRQELMRRNINRLKGEVKADTVIGASHAMFAPGMADWSVMTTQRRPGINDTRLNLTLGAMVAGGETIVSLNYNNLPANEAAAAHDSTNTIRTFDERQQYYRWRWVNNSNPDVRQVIAGKILTQSIASIYNQVVGVQVTNTPSTYRRAFGTHTLSRFIEPGWGVELYVNNELVDFTKADAAGFFTFQVPLVYGNTLVKLRYYSPWGQERFAEENISIPFTFLPFHEFEYTASAGIVEDTSHSRFGRVNMNYGATNFLTVGGGVEYLSSVTSGTVMPFMNASVKIADDLLFFGDYTQGVRTKAVLTYGLPTHFQAELNYTRFEKEQKAISFNYLEERKASISKAFVGRYSSLYTRMGFTQDVMPAINYTTLEWMVSGAIRRVGVNAGTYATFSGHMPPIVYSNIALTFWLPSQLQVTPQLQYEYSSNKLVSARCEVGKYFFNRGYVSALYERNFRNDILNMGISLRYDFAFSQVGASLWRNNGVNTLSETARGSFVYNTVSRNVDVNNRVSVGTGGILIRPFLDLNGNGKQDAGEPKADGLQIGVNGGTVIYNRRDTSIYIRDLEPYSNYYLDMGRNTFENIAWRVKHPVVKVAVEPNRVRAVDVPVVVAGEVSGNVYMVDNTNQTGIGRIAIMLYREDKSLEARMLTEGDGYFSYLGLVPGNYTVGVDSVQMRKLRMSVSPKSIPIHISASQDGDVIDGLKFLIKRLPQKVPDKRVKAAAL